MHDSNRGVDGKLIVGGSDPTYIPAAPPFTGTLVAAWGVFGMPFGSSPLGGLIPRAVVQIGPPCPPATLGGIPLVVPNSLEVNGFSLFIGTRINQGINIKQGISQMLGTKSDVGSHSHTGLKNQSGVSINTAMKLSGKVMDYGGNILANKKDKPFDMEHPTKPGWRLRHVCLEGPEIGVYKHGRGKGRILNLPDYWKGLVKQETITVQLTPIQQAHTLFVEKIEDNCVFVGSNDETEDFEYFYLLHASRYDDDLIVEYEGTSHEDYPGGNSGYEFSWENDNIERLVKEVIREKLNDGSISGTMPLTEDS